MTPKILLTTFLKELRAKAIFKDELFKKIVKNTGIILSGNTAASALGFFSFAIMANSLGPELLAYFALAQLFTGLVNSLFNVQTWESMIKFGTKEDEVDRLASTIKTNFIIDFVSACFAFLFAVFSLRYIATLMGWNEELIEIAFLYCFIIPFTLTTFTIGIPRLFDKFILIAKIQFFAAILKLVLISVLGYYDGSAKEFTSVYIVVDILIKIALIVLSFKVLSGPEGLDWIRAKIHLNKEHIKFLWWTNLRTIVRIPVRQLDILIISQVMTLEAVGMYKAYKEVVGVIGKLGEPVNQAIYPEYAKLLGSSRTSETLAVTKKIMLILSSISLLTLVFFMFTSELIFETFFGVEYLSLISAFYILVVLNSINLFLTPINSLFLAAGFARIGFYIVLLNNILYLLVAMIGGIYFGIYGIVLAFAVQMAFNQGLKIVFLRKYSTGWGKIIR